MHLAIFLMSFFLPHPDGISALYYSLDSRDYGNLLCFSLVELILCKSCLTFMSDFASTKNRNAAEEKKTKGEVSNILV